MTFVTATFAHCIEVAKKVFISIYMIFVTAINMRSLYRSSYVSSYVAVVTIVMA